MYYVIETQDKPNSLALRQQVRPDHLAFLKDLGDTVKLAGPFLNDSQEFVGSLIIIEADSLAAAEAIAAADPYVAAGLFEHASVRPWAWAINPPQA